MSRSGSIIPVFRTEMQASTRRSHRLCGSKLEDGFGSVESPPVTLPRTRFHPDTRLDRGGHDVGSQGVAYGWSGSVALVVCKIKASLPGEAVKLSSPVAAAEVGVRWIPLPARGHRRRCPVVPALNLSYRDVEELLIERGIEVDHVTVFRWVERFTSLLADAARFARHSPGDRWFIDETYFKVNGIWRYVYRAVDQHNVNQGPLCRRRRGGCPADTHPVRGRAIDGQPGLSMACGRCELMLQQLGPDCAKGCGTSRSASTSKATLLTSG